MSEKRKSIIEIAAPTLGIVSNVPRNIMEPRSQPTGLNARIKYGLNQKDYGTTLFGTDSSIGQPIYLINEAVFGAASVLQIHTNTTVYRNTGTSGLVFAVDGQTVSGTYGDYWAALQYNDAYIYCNGKGTMQYKASLATTGTDLGSAISPTTLNAYALGALKDHLCLYHVWENGTEYGKRVQWTKKGALTYSAGTTDFWSGTAGAIDLQDCEGYITNAVPLSGGIAVYAENSIHMQQWIGGDEIYRFTKQVSEIGAISRRGVVSHGDVNYFLAENNVYAYYGGNDIRAIGDPIKATMFSEINQSARKHAFVEYNSIDDIVNFHIPVNTDTSPTVVWSYDIKDESWMRKTSVYTEACEYGRTSAVTIGDLVGSIGDQNYQLGSLSPAAGERVQLYADPSGRIVKKDITVRSISVGGTSTAQNWIYETPDLTGAPQKDPNGSKVDFISTRQRWLQATIWASGNGTMAIECTTDGGRSYAVLPQSPATLAVTGAPIVVSLQKRSPQLALRLSNTELNSPVAVEYIKTEFIPGSDNA